MTAYGPGCRVVVAAMPLAGCVVPQRARQFAAAPQGEVDVVYIILRVIGPVIQVQTKAGLVSICIAFLA